MGLRLNIKAFMFLSTTTFTKLGSSINSFTCSTCISEATCTFSSAKTANNFSSGSFCTKGSSPCTFTTISTSISPIASAIRSLPLSCSLILITALPPLFITSLKMISLSVTTVTSSNKFVATVLLYVCRITVLSPSICMSLAGKRVAA